MNVRDLSPKEIWNHFEDLNAVPRPSKKEERVRQFMKDFGANLGLEVLEDAIGNVIIKKPASSGMENRETVILQSHLDMVHQKNLDTNFDFDSEGIQSYIDGDWVTAKGTTLGADNGMGVAASMAILSSTEVQHPAIEALFTIDEETGMTGAKELNGSLLNGKILLNLDTEDDDEFSIGCAGGIDTNTAYKYHTEIIAGSMKTIKISIRGLKGGHSGMDIILGRGNANQLLNRLVFEVNQQLDLRYVSFDGGGLRNAIPREADAICAIAEENLDKCLALLQEFGDEIKENYKVTEPDFKILVEKVKIDEKECLTKVEHDLISRTIYATPNGVWRMSENIEGLVETSSSLARVVIGEGEFKTQSLQRSMGENGKKDIANALRATYELIGAEVVQSGDYPGWAPNPNSPILKVLEEKYEKMFNEKPHVAACHAGLECGILSEHLPGCDMISFGPTIRNPHSPDEKVNIASVQKFWNFLLEVLSDTPVKSNYSVESNAVGQNT